MQSEARVAEGAGARLNKIVVCVVGELGWRESGSQPTFIHPCIVRELVGGLGFGNQGVFLDGIGGVVEGQCRRNLLSRFFWWGRVLHRSTLQPVMS